LTNVSKRAQRGSQKERVFAHKQRILYLLDQGARLKTIRDDLDLATIPYSTFQRLVRDIRIEAAKRDVLIAAQEMKTMSSSPPVSAQDDPAKPACEIVEVLQPEREGMKPPDEEPRKPAKRKRRRKGVITPNLDAKDQNLDPSKWSSEL